MLRKEDFKWISRKGSSKDNNDEESSPELEMQLHKTEKTVNIILSLRLLFMDESQNINRTV